MPKSTAKGTAIQKEPRYLNGIRLQNGKHTLTGKAADSSTPVSSFLFFSIRPSVDIVTTCQGINSLFFQGCHRRVSIPPQQGTSILTIVRLLMSF